MASTVQPDDKITAVYDLFDKLRTQRPDQMDAYANLVASICVVHDEPLKRNVNENKVTAPDPIAIFDYYVANEKSMAFGYLANLVATIPTWIRMQINQAELDVAPATGGNIEQKRLDESQELLQALAKASAEARTAFENTSDEHLKTNWRLLARGQVVMEAPRYEMIQDTFNHWAHHRGQMTVYLRLMGARVPSIYGPSADDKQFR